jgi:surfeit locus 1 family protein
MKQPPLIPLLIVIAFVILMPNLGFWQLNRAHEKEDLLVLLANNNVTHINEAQQVKSLPQYANIKMVGHFLNSPQLLLDNQVDNQHVGYHVFTQFLDDGLNLFIMVNRGWIGKDDFNSENLKVDSNSFTLQGKLNHSPQVGIQLGEIELDNNLAQQIMTYYDREKVKIFLYENLCKDLNCIVSDRVLLMKKNQNSGFKRDWNPIIMPPSKHIGYAVQWFSMTFVLIVIFIYWVYKLED